MPIASSPSACASCEEPRSLGGVVPRVLDEGARAEVVAGDPQSVGFRDRTGFARRAPVIVAAELELGVAGVAQHLERAGHVELVVGQQVAHHEHLDADAIERDVAARAEAIVLVVAAVTATVAVSRGRARNRTQRADSCRTAGGTDEPATGQCAPVGHLESPP